jgi:exodeoxyribonuclease VII small subunit
MMSTSEPSDSGVPVNELSYTEASRELDQIVSFFEQREVDVDQLVARLERATAIVDELDRRIRRTRAQVEQLVPRLEAAAQSPQGPVSAENDEGSRVERSGDRAERGALEEGILEEAFDSDQGGLAGANEDEEDEPGEDEQALF